MGIILKETAIIGVENDCLEKNKKEKEYLDYINTHIANVKKAYEIYFKPLLLSYNLVNGLSDELFKEAIREAEVNIDKHDESKFGDDEFDGYRAKYYPTEAEKLLSDEDQRNIMDRAELCWEHHYTNNPHHPKYWIDKQTGEIKDMELVYIIEMICDWQSFSIKSNNESDSAWNFYTTKAIDEKKAMTDNTKQLVEAILKYIHGINM